jgi:3-oxoacyl-[acyl-carrier protein] reductase
MDLELKGRRAFVSGSSSGIGKGIALELAAAGCDVVVHGRDKPRTEETAHEIAKFGVKTAVTIGDLATDDGAKKVADDTLAAFGNIDILINNAGNTLRKDNPDWSTLPAKEWVDSFEVNFVSGIRMGQRFVPAMKEKRWGRIINISSTTATHVLGGALADYGAPKAALNKLTADMAKTLGQYNITVNCIIPGTIMTPAIETYMGFLKKQRGWGNDPLENERRYTLEVYPQSVPRLGVVRDIGAATAFLSSPLAGYINGAFLRIDGGMANFV